MSQIATTARGDAAWTRDRPQAQRWSARRSLAFVALTCGAFWGAVLAAL